MPDQPLTRPDPPEPDDEETLALSAGRRPESSAETQGLTPDFGFAPPPPSVAHYRLIRKLGQGGQGTVFLAEDTRLQRRVALKILGDSRQHTPRSKERFRREAAAVSRLDDPGLAAVFDAGEDSGVLYIAMRFVEGEPLDRRLALGLAAAPVEDRTDAEKTESGSSVTQSATGPAERTAAWLHFYVELLRALQVAHDAGLVHRDIKPANIMVTPEGRPVILDFGLARPDDEELATLTQSDDVLGTPAYMAPEQITRNRDGVDARTDLHAVGICLYETLSGQRPFVAPTREGLYRAILESSPPSLSGVSTRFTSDLRVVLDRALEKEPNRRYLSARAFGADLEAMLEGRSISARPVGTLGRLLRWARRHPGLATLLTLLAIAILASVGLGLFTLGRQPLVEQGRAAQRQAELDATLERAFLLHGAGRVETARDLMEDATIDDRIVPEALALLVSELSRRHQDRESLALLERHRPESVGRRGLDRVVDFCRLRIAGTDSQEAIDQTLRFEARDHVDFLVLSLRDEAMAEREYAGAAVSSAQNMLQSILLSPRPRAYDFGRLAELAGRAKDQKLLQLAERALLQRWPTSAVAHYWAGRGRFFAEDYERAGSHLKEALRLDPTLDPAWVTLARLRYTNEDSSGAEEALARAEALVPGDAVVSRTRGELCLAEGEFAEAEAALLASLDVAPAHDDTWYALGDARAQQGNYRGAAEAYTRAVQLDGDYGPYNARLAEVLVLDGRLDEALRAIDHCARVDPEFSVRRAREWLASNASAVPARMLRRARDRHPDLVPAGSDDEAFLIGSELAAAFGLGRDAIQLDAAGRRDFLDRAAEDIDRLLQPKGGSTPPAPARRLHALPGVKRLLDRGIDLDLSDAEALAWQKRREALRKLLN